MQNLPCSQTLLSSLGNTSPVPEFQMSTFVAQSDFQAGRYIGPTMMSSMHLRVHRKASQTQFDPSISQPCCARAASVFYRCNAQHSNTNPCHYFDCKKYMSWWKKGCTWDDDSKLLDLFTFETYHVWPWFLSRPSRWITSSRWSHWSRGRVPTVPTVPTWPPWPNRTTEHEHPDLPTCDNVACEDAGEPKTWCIR